MRARAPGVHGWVAPSRPARSRIAPRRMVGARADFPSVLFALAALALTAPGPAEGQTSIDLGWEILATPHLPSSIELHRSTLSLPGGEPLFGVYARIDLTDPAVEVQATYVGDGGTRITPLQEAQRSPRPAYLAVNGTFFSATTSVSPVVDAGRVLAFGRQGLERNGRSYPATWGAWGIDPAGRSEVIWSWSIPDSGQILAFDAPWPVRLGAGELPEPSLAAPGMPPGRIWEPQVAMGGTPVLIKSGVLRNLAEDPADPESIVNRDELANPGGLTGRHPRTAVGLTSDRRTLILMVIDGRQPDHSVGVTLQELGAIMVEVGAFEALNIDGGGSSVFIADNGDGMWDIADVLTRPSDAAGMRPVATSLLVRAR